MIQVVDMGGKLKALRTENGLTQTQVAQRLGVAVSAVSSYESGVRYPSYSVLIKLSRMYHVTTDYLLGVKTKEMVDISDLSEDDKAVVKATISALRAKYTK